MKPVSLLTANAINESAEITRTRPDAWQDAQAADSICDATARKLLCNVAHEATMPMIWRALAAIDAPATRVDIMARINSAAEGLREEMGEASP